MHANYRKANAAPRCQYIRLNDQPCTQPALQGNVFCRFHELVDHPLPDARQIPFVEDATSLQVALMQVIRALQRHEMDRPTAGTILYALQIAASNLKHFCEENGHPLASPAPRVTRKEQEQEEALAGPSLAEILLQRLQVLEDEHAEEAADEHAAAKPAATDAHPPLPLRSSASPAVQSESATIDKLEACIGPRVFRSSDRPLHARLSAEFSSASSGSS